MRRLSHAHYASKLNARSGSCCMTLAPTRRSRVRLAVLLASVVAALANGQSPPDAASAPTELHYRLSFDDARQRVMQVDLALPPVTGLVELVMSRSSPGRYALHEFATNVFD